MNMRAINSVVTLHTGEAVELGTLYAKQPLALVFLRHFGCIFCREQIAQLRNFSDENVVFVGMGNIEETAAFRLKMESPQTYISDPNKSLYEEFGLRRGSFAQMFNTSTFRRGFDAMRAGTSIGGRPVGDPMMLAGVFVIDTSGEIIHSHFSRDASDNLSGNDISAMLREIQPATV
jgi:peroxiredoxin